MWLRISHGLQRLTVWLSLAEGHQPAHLMLETEQLLGSKADLCDGARYAVGSGTEVSACAGGNECRA
jgi:hypothetical protein